jgi:hypothetical protein
MLYCAIHSDTLVCCSKHCAFCTVTLSISPISCNVQFTQLHLFALPKTVLSVQYRSPSPLYAVLCNSLSYNCLLYKTLYSLYSNALTLPYMLYCAIHSVTPICCTKLCALCTVPLSLSPICCIVQFTQSHFFSVLNSLHSVQFRSHSPLYVVLYRSHSLPVCSTKHCALSTVPLSLTPICSIVQFTQSACLLYQILCSLYSTALTLPYMLYCTVHSVILFAVPNNVLSVLYRSHPPLYAVLYSSLSHTCLLYQTLCCL